MLLSVTLEARGHGLALRVKVAVGRGSLAV